MEQSIDVNKIRFIASYFGEKVNGLTVTKMMKLFYYTDFISFNERGSSISGDVYFKLPYGPVPTFIKSEMDTLIKGGLETDIDSVFRGYLKAEAFEKPDYKGYILKNTSKRPSESCLSEYEFGLVEKVVSKFKSTSAKKLSEKTHKEEPYTMTSDAGIIDYALSKYLKPNQILNG